MKIATNITRSNVGGISVSNINFLNHIHKTGEGVVAFELVSGRHFKGTTAFSHFSQEWFDHNIINVFDKPIFKAIKKAKNIKDLTHEYGGIIKVIKRILKKNEVDVVLLNGTYYIPWLISIAAHELKIPMVLRYAGVYSLEMDMFDIPKKEKKLFFEIEKSFLKRVKFFIFPSTLCREAAKKQLKISGKAIINNKNNFIISNPVNVPRGLKISSASERKIAAVGRWDYIKNFPAFFKLHKELLKENWKHEATFVTAGGKIPGLPKTIKRLKSVPYSEIFKFYAQQGLIVSPSHFETFGNVPMEAVCLGVPVLVNENMGCVDVLKKAGLSEMVMPFADIRKVAERAKDIYGKKIPLAKINYIKKMLSPEKINKEILSVLKKAVKK